MIHAHEGAPAPETTFTQEDYWKKKRTVGGGALWLARRQERNAVTDSADTAGQLQEALPADTTEVAGPMTDTDDRWSDGNAFVSDTYHKKQGSIGLSGMPNASEFAQAAGITPSVA